MLKGKHPAIALAVVAAWSAASALGQTPATATAGVPGPATVGANTGDKPEERAGAVIRIIDGDKASTRAEPVNTGELARARAAGEMQTAERGEPIQIERIQIDDPVASGEKARLAPVVSNATPAQVTPLTQPQVGQGRSASPQTQARSDPRPQIVQVQPGTETKGRTQTRAVVRLDDAARYRETAKYEADKKRREIEKPVAATEQARPRTTEQPVTVLGSAQGKAEISWSNPEQQDSR